MAPTMSHTAMIKKNKNFKNARFLSLWFNTLGIFY
jgi:hypothetical protein